MQKRPDTSKKTPHRTGQHKLRGDAPLQTVVVGGNAGYRRAVLRLLKTHPGIAFAGSAGSSTETDALLAQCSPQLVLIDVRLPDCSGFELARRVKQMHAGAKVVLIAAEDDREYRDAAARAGADGLACRDDLAQQLSAWIRNSSTAPIPRQSRGDAKAARKSRAAPAVAGEAWNRFRSTFNQAAVGIIHSTTEGWILEANRRLCDLLGYSSSELRTLNTRDLTHPDDRDRQDAQQLELVSGLRGSFSSEKRYLRKDGRPIWVNRTVALGYEQPGADPYLIHTIEDITERKHAEQALQQSQMQYASLVGSLDSILWEADAQTFRFIFVSQQAEKLLGYPVERWLDEPTFWRDHIHPEDRDWAFSYCVEATREMRPHDFEYRMIAADGRVVWLRDIVNVLVENGRPARARGVMVDITAGKQAEMDARRYARACRVMAECSHALVHAVNESDLLREMCRIIVDSGGYQQGWIGLVSDDPARRILPVAQAGYHDDAPLPYAGLSPDGREPGAAVTAANSGETVVVRDILSQPGHAWRRARALKNGFQSSIALPLRGEGRTLGVLVMHAPEPDAFNEEEIALLSTLADDIGYGLMTLRADAARNETERRLFRLARARKVMAECGQALVHATDESKLLDEMCRVAVESGGFRQAWIALVTGRGPLRVRAAAHAGYGDNEPMTGASNWAADGSYQGLAAEAINSGEISIARDILNDPLQARKRLRALELNYQSSIALPLREEGNVVAAVVLHAAERDAFDEEEIALLGGMVEDLSYGIANLRTQQARRQAEERLRESEQRVREVFDQAAVGIARSDLDGVLVEVNQKFCDMLGYAREDLIGRHNRDITHPDDYGKGARVREELQGGARIGSASGEKRFLRKDGTYVWARRTLSAAYDDAGNANYVVAVIEDITERKGVEQQFQATFDQAAVGIAHVDFSNIYIRVNRKLCEITGYDEAELIGVSAGSRFSYPEDIGSGEAERKRLLAGEIASFSNEKRYIHKDGRMLWVKRTESLARDADGKPVYCIRVIEDITDRKRAEEAVVREQMLLRTIIDTLPDRIYVKDAEGRFLLENAANLKVHGIQNHEEVVGKTVFDLFPREVAQRLHAEDQAIVESGTAIVNRERVVKDSSGQMRWHLTTKVPLRDAAGNVTGVVGVNRDITGRKRMEQELREGVERFQIAARATNDVIRDWNLATGQFWWSEGLSTLFGYRMEDVKPGIESWYEGIHPADRERVVRDIHRVIDSGEKSWSDEYRFRRADGSYADIFDRGYVIHGEGGKPVRMIGAMMDVTERAQSARRRGMEYAVTSVLAESPTLDAAIPRLIRAVCEAMGWAYGARWVCDAQGRSMHRADNWSDFEADFDPADRELWLRQEGPDASKSLLRRAWADRGPVWVADFERLAEFRRGPSAKKFSLRSAFAFPVIMGGSVVALLEFFSHEARQPDEGLLDVARSIGNQIAQFVQNKQAEAALKEAEQQFRQLAGNIPQVFWITDAAQQETIYISPAWQEITGRPLDEIRENPRSWLDSVHEEDRERVKQARKAALAGGYDETFRVVRPDGSIRWVHDRAFPVHDEGGGVYRIAGIAEDITDRKQAEAQLMQLAHYDVLTSLPNRALFYDRLKQSLAHAKRNQWNVGVLFIDVDRFKNVNDTLGHVVGDQLLRQVSERLIAVVRAGDTVGRLGGDEFAIVLSNLTSAQDANLVAQKILASFNDAFGLEGAELYVTASVGISLYPDDSLDQDTLIRNADAAMYRAKELGRNNYQFYTPEMNTRAQALLSMESSLRRALDRNEFLLHFQPKASAATGEITGVEALLRWRHPERGLVSPAEFIPVLEETGLIVPVGEWVIRAVCEQVRAWQQAGIAPVPVAVNLSARQFQSSRLGAGIVSVIESSGIEPRLLECEITESSLMQNADSAVVTLQFLKSYGMRISIDDFGTGYSSLAYLKRFPLDALKIDRSFVRDLTTDPDDAAITRAVISMAHSLGLKVIAEGVETESQFEFLAGNGCDEIQGYLFARPLSAEDCAVLLKEGRRLQRPSPPVETAPVVLLVDDDDDALTLLKRTLTRDRYQILTACNAHEALDVLGRNRVDLVISDQHMPGVQGVEFLQRVKRLHPRTVRLMTSGAADVQIVTDAINKGEIFRFLPKGMREDQLRSDVREALQFRSRISQDLHPAAAGAKDR